MCLDRGRDGVGLSRNDSISRENSSGSSSSGDGRESCLAGFLLISLLSSLVLLVCDSLGHDIGQELEVVDTGNCAGWERVSGATLIWKVKSVRTDILVLDVSSGLLFGLDNILSLFNQVLKEKLSRSGDGESSVV